MAFEVSVKDKDAAWRLWLTCIGKLQLRPLRFWNKPLSTDNDHPLEKHEKQLFFFFFWSANRL